MVTGLPVAVYKSVVYSGNLACVTFQIVDPVTKLPMGLAGVSATITLTLGKSTFTVTATSDAKGAITFKIALPTKLPAGKYDMTILSDGLDSLLKQAIKVALPNARARRVN